MNYHLRPKDGGLVLLQYAKYRSLQHLSKDCGISICHIFNAILLSRQLAGNRLLLCFHFHPRKGDLDSRTRAYALYCLLSQTVRSLITYSSSQQPRINRSGKLRPVLCRTDHILRVLSHPRSYVRDQVLHSRQSHFLPVP